MEKSTDTQAASQRPHIVEIGKIADPRGNLSVIEGHKVIPFDVRRVFYLYDVPADSCRGGHAHHTDWQFLIAVAGSFDVIVSDGCAQQRYTLNRPYRGLLIPPGYWRVMDNFSAGSVCLVLSNNPYDESDYIRDYDEFVRTRKQHE